MAPSYPQEPGRWRVRPPSPGVVGAFDSFRSGSLAPLTCWEWVDGVLVRASVLCEFCAFVAGDGRPPAAVIGGAGSCARCRPRVSGSPVVPAARGRAAPGDINCGIAAARSRPRLRRRCCQGSTDCGDEGTFPRRQRRDRCTAGTPPSAAASGSGRGFSLLRASRAGNGPGRGRPRRSPPCPVAWQPVFS